MKRIFLVDDDPDIASLLKEGLEMKGLKVDSFSDPIKALAQYKPNAYDLLIIDIRMSKLNGFELVREIRKVDNAVTVWFLTAFEVYYDEFSRMFPNLDVKSFVRKPISASDLAKKIEEELGGKSKQ